MPIIVGTVMYPGTEVVLSASSALARNRYEGFIHRNFSSMSRSRSSHMHKTPFD